MDIGQIILQLLAATAGSFGFTIVFHVQRKEWLAASLGGLFSWAVYLLVFSLFGHDYLAAFLGASFFALYGEILARIKRAPSTVFTVIAFVPLIPGASLYRAADTLMNSQIRQGEKLAVYTLAFAASMSAGIVFTTLLLHKCFPGSKS